MFPGKGSNETGRRLLTSLLLPSFLSGITVACFQLFGKSLVRIDRLNILVSLSGTASKASFKILVEMLSIAEDFDVSISVINFRTSSVLVSFSLSILVVLYHHNSMGCRECLISSLSLQNIH